MHSFHSNTNMLWRHLSYYEIVLRIRIFAILVIGSIRIANAILTINQILSISLLCCIIFR